ncbi:MAG TPA: beta-ketoacyl synthase N-terminal-like domain-containing protein [Stackebrandtia sp.]|uniref:beta-ketoacyl synthase N-terminal-like domain-containing protein n=1 Tax=Stackebrandtia sp. TaxID=2023065 RepID=UPI002D32F015|nr:beta-ketoacyl synthase N-terminal-like domain-containing protein [Stackebrandtia sp.]HZE38734.1 beta-ketoacyl synthase N-terminal-like domain-containing protein [Stackebrandtia sp.]
MQRRAKDPMHRRIADARAIAIVGMACRIPGATGPDELWELLCGEVDATSVTPPERYDVDAVHSKKPAAGKMISRRAGYLEGMAEFDATFFDLSEAEATELDPQQRQLLMATWEALEDAGQPPSVLAGSRTGVFVGNTRADHLENAFRRGLESATASQFHNLRPMIPARVSHFFDLRGPSVLVDTACSSSLVAVHHAVQSLRAGEVPVAIAAGANLALRPDESVMMSQAGTLSGDGRSKFGGADADGHAPSDGIAVVVLKPLEDAIADGDRVRAVIAGSAVGNDGRSGETILNPSLDGQVDVLRWAYEDADIDPGEVDYVEAHGSGSPLLDPLELNALGQVLGEGRPPDRPLLVGSVKSNVGHSEAAGSLVGLIKAVLCLEHGQIPASLHAANPNPDVNWDDLPVEIPVKRIDLPELDRPAIAGVSGQGASAFNAHVVLRQVVEEDAAMVSEPQSGRLAWVWQRIPGRGPQEPQEEPDRPCLLALSGHTPEALEEMIGAYAQYLGADGAGSEYPLWEICRSAAMRRQHLKHRKAFIASTHEEMVRLLTGASEPMDYRDLTVTAALYRKGKTVDWEELFGGAGRYIPLPGYRWQTKRFWPEETESESDEDLAARILRQRARTSFDTDSTLAEIGIDSLAKLELIVELQKVTGHEVEPEAFDRVRTVGELRDWARELEAAAR